MISLPSSSNVTITMHQFLTLPNISISLLFIFILFKLYNRSKSQAKNLPPGPWNLPIIGSLHHLISSVPHRALRDLAHKYGPIMHLKLGAITTIVVSSPDAAKQVLKTRQEEFSERHFLLVTSIISYDFKDLVFAKDEDYWRQMRRIFTMELLSMNRIRSFRSIREAEVAKMVEQIASNVKSPVNVSQIINSLTYAVISKAAFGKVWKGEEAFKSAMGKLIDAASGFNFSDIYPSLKFMDVIRGTKQRVEKYHKQLDIIFQEILDEHKAKKHKKDAERIQDEEQDIVDVLLSFQDKDDLQFQLADTNIKALIWDIFSAGSDTSLTALEWAMSELMKDPQIMVKAQTEVREVFGAKGIIDEQGIQDLKYLKLIIKETLRLHPPFALLLPRVCGKKCALNGYEIPEKSQVTINVWAIGTDSNYWNDPDKFYPERFLDNSIDFRGNHFEFIPFGAGKRVCPGILFGNAIIELVLANLLYHFDWKLANGLELESFDMTERFGPANRRKDELYLIPSPYLPSLINENSKGGLSINIK